MGNWAQERGKLEIVIDATLPEVVIISAPEGDLEGGESTKITIFANDSYEIIQVLIEFGDMMEPMVKTADPNIWEYELEIPSDAGIYTYTIHVEDINHNWNYISGSIEVVTIPEPRLGPGPVNIWGFIAIISIIIIGISIAIAVRINKQTGDQRSERSSQILKDKNHYLLRGHSKIVEVKCPSCRMKKNVPLSISIPPDSNGLCTVYIYRNVVCEHTFHFYIDNNYDIRGSEPVDYSFGEEL